MKVFICTYTCDAKAYCDKEFFTNLITIAKESNSPLYIVDNTKDNKQYTEKIEDICIEVNRKTHIPWCKIEHLDISIEPKESIFQRRVAESVNKCREEFLKTDCDWILIVESDVIPPVEVLVKFEEDIKNIEEKIDIETGRDYKPLGILGALYYQGFHNYELKGLQQTHHVLSGCSLYSRTLIEKYPFRYDPDNLGPFPDAFIAFDSGQEYSLYNDHDIKCAHLASVNGSRYSKSII